MKHPNQRLRVEISPDDAGLLLVALWVRTRDAANRHDYADLRDRLLTQLRAQGVDVSTGDDLIGEHDESDTNDDAMFRNPVCHKCSQEFDDLGDCPDLCPQPWHVEQE
jgi:hypothetical protein